MRVHLTAQLSGNIYEAPDHTPVVLTIRPACGLPGKAEYRTTAPELLKLLRRRTELDALVLKSFENKIRDNQIARLSHITVSDELLEHVGFFID